MSARENDRLREIGKLLVFINPSGYVLFPDEITELEKILQTKQQEIIEFVDRVVLRKIKDEPLKFQLGQIKSGKYFLEGYRVNLRSDLHLEQTIGQVPKTKYGCDILRTGPIPDRTDVPSDAPLMVGYLYTLY